MSNMVIQPMQIVVAGVVWLQAEIQELKNLFAGQPAIVLDKETIRSSAVLQKALNGEVAVSSTVQTGDTAILQLAQVGYDMFGQV